MASRGTDPGGDIRGSGSGHSRAAIFLTPQKADKLQTESKHSTAMATILKGKKRGERIKLPEDLGNPSRLSPEMLWSDKGTPFPKQLLTRFKAYDQSCKRVREAKKMQHRLVQYLIHHDRMSPDRARLHDAAGTLSHALLLRLALFEIDQPKLNKPLPPLLEVKVSETQITESEHVTAFAQERRRAVKKGETVLSGPNLRESYKPLIGKRVGRSQRKRSRSAESLPMATIEHE